MKEKIINDFWFEYDEEGNIVEKDFPNLYAHNSPYILKCNDDGKFYRLKITQDESPENPREDRDNMCIFAGFLRNHYSPDTVSQNNATDWLKSLCYDYVDADAQTIESWDWQKCYNELNKSNKCCISLVKYYEHSGFSVSMDTNSYPYNYRWDSGLFGFIFVSKNSIFQNGGGLPMLNNNGKRIYKQCKDSEDYATYSAQVEPLTEENWKKVAYRFMHSEVEMYDQWLQNDIYGYELEEVEPVYYCNKCGIVFDDINSILSNEQLELDGKVHHRCPDCYEDLDIEGTDKLDITLHKYEVVKEIDSCWGFYGSDTNTNGILSELPIKNWEIVKEEK